MNAKSINTLVLAGIIGFVSIGSSFFIDLYRAFYAPQNIYWTHQSMKLPLEQADNTFQLYFGGKLLQKRLAEQTLLAVDDNGVPYALFPEDITVRLNHWDQVKSAILTKTAFTGFAFGITLTLLITGLIQTIYQKNARKTPKQKFFKRNN